MRPSSRAPDEMRSISIQTGVLTHAEGSCLIEFGDTRVICAATVERRVPFFRRNTGLGWIRAEYAMLPRATSSRSNRESAAGRQSGRSQEIQRLIGRALRASIDLAALGEIQIIVDCDVINADGGTRCAAVTGGWVALRLAASALMKSRTVHRDPVIDNVAAVSCGIFGGRPVLDMDYAEDFEAETDANFVLTGSGQLVEVQCSAESAPFAEDALLDLLRLAKAGTGRIVELQNEAIGG